jgi:hypothetical protein
VVAHTRARVAVAREYIDSRLKTPLRGRRARPFYVNTPRPYHYLLVNWINEARYSRRRWRRRRRRRRRRWWRWWWRWRRPRNENKGSAEVGTGATRVARAASGRRMPAPLPAPAPRMEDMCEPTLRNPDPVESGLGWLALSPEELPPVPQTLGQFSRCHIAFTRRRIRLRNRELLLSHDRTCNTKA